ncbi:MAG: trypsin-like serine protease [Byssovorax sp.]
MSRRSSGRVAASGALLVATLVACTPPTPVVPPKPPHAPAAEACGPGVVSSFHYALRAANQGDQGLIAARREQPDAHLAPGAACSIEPAVGALTLENQSLHCTATLISSRVALTAAHCVHRYDAQRLRFVLGDDIASEDALRYRVASAVVPSSYVQGCNGSDVAAVILEEDVVDVTPARLRAQPLAGGATPQLTYVGYGFAKFAGNEGAGIKRCADLPVEQANGQWFRAHLGAENVCHGDSGGPALERFQGGYRIAGVTSWGDTDCHKYVVSTDVGGSAAWIQEVVADAAKQRPALRIGDAHAVVELALSGGGDTLDGMEVFPGFPYYSDESDNPTVWPPRVDTDRTTLANQITAFVTLYPRIDPSIKVFSSAPDAPGDTWPRVSEQYSGYRLLANFTLHGDAAALTRKLGKKTAAAFFEVEKARNYLRDTMPNRLWILRVRNESLAEAGPMVLKFKIAGARYDIGVSAAQHAVANDPDGSVIVTVPHLVPREVTEIKVWYNYLPLAKRAFPSPRDVELEKTQGIEIVQFNVAGARIVRSSALVRDVIAAAYTSFPGLAL